jgi:hypothetical protein
MSATFLPLATLATTLRGKPPVYGGSLLLEYKNQLKNVETLHVISLLYARQ